MTYPREFPAHVCSARWFRSARWFSPPLHRVSTGINRHNLPCKMLLCPTSPILHREESFAEFISFLRLARALVPRNRHSSYGCVTAVWLVDTVRLDQDCSPSSAPSFRFVVIIRLALELRQTLTEPSSCPTCLYFYCSCGILVPTCVASNIQDVWGTCIHPDDHKTFFESLSLQLFHVPGHFSESTQILKVKREQWGFLFHIVLP